MIKYYTQCFITRRKASCITVGLIALSIFTFAFISSNEKNQYRNFYFQSTNNFKQSLNDLEAIILSGNLNSKEDLNNISTKIADARMQLKAIDFWLRYEEPIAYKKINGPLPVEWETEVFEKYEKPYRREGAGLTLAYNYLEEETLKKDSLLYLIRAAQNALQTFYADSITLQLNNYNNFFLSNRLFLLNLAAIYTTGFECPDKNAVIPELQFMLFTVEQIYNSYNSTFPQFKLNDTYLNLYASMLQFVKSQPTNPEQYNHYVFIKKYVNPLFALNQNMILKYKVISNSYNDFSLNDSCNSMFDKKLYNGQYTKGSYFMVTDKATLSEIKHIGKLLFYDPLLSKNNLRSCASCHKPAQYFTDTTVTTSLQFNHIQNLERNTPTLINAIFNHLLMLDGKHISLINQVKDVTTNPVEMADNENEILKKVLSCKEYKSAFNKFLGYTKIDKSVTFEHIASAITMYYSDFSFYQSAFDDAMNGYTSLDQKSIDGFNLFMSKAQCATCHFVPQFNGVKPPFVSSEFEVLGVPYDTIFSKLSSDKGRYMVNPAKETLHAFRTGSLRNAAHTMPYMHNGVFSTMDQVLDFYNGGGGAGKKLSVENQTLSADTLGLTPFEIKAIEAFMESLNENIKFELPPEQLPTSKNKNLNSRKIGGVY
jgi:cytochrome c peroxidase